MYSWKDKLRDWANQQGAWTHILVAVAIALLITAIILGVAMPSKGQVNTNTADIAETVDTVGKIASTLGTKASKAELDSWGENVSVALDVQAGTLSAHGVRLGNAENKIEDVAGNVTDIQGKLAALNSPPEAYLTGTFGNYTVHAECSEAGNFTANVHLVYSSAFGCNGTYEECQQFFYSGITWTKGIPYYCTVVTFNGTAWGVSEVWWNIGTFQLVANNETAIAVMCVGLNSTWEPDFAYVEIYPVLR